MRRALAVLLFACLILPSSIAGRIVPDACIAGVGLWDSSAQVLRTWGKPIRKSKDPPGTRWHYRRGSVLLERWGKQPTPNKHIVLAVTTTDPRERTPRGIGVGSLYRQVRTAHPKAGCPRQGYCDIGAVLWAFTTLKLKNGRVTEVAISLESSYDDGALQKPDPRCRATG